MKNTIREHPFEPTSVYLLLYVSENCEKERTVANTSSFYNLSVIEGVTLLSYHPVIEGLRLLLLLPCFPSLRKTMMIMIMMMRFVLSRRTH